MRTSKKRYYDDSGKLEMEKRSEYFIDGGQTRYGGRGRLPCGPLNLLPPLRIKDIEDKEKIKMVYNEKVEQGIRVNKSKWENRVRSNQLEKCQTYKGKGISGRYL